MKKLPLTTVVMLVLISGCSDESDIEPTTSINSSNAIGYSKMVYQQLIALHSHDLLTRNTAVNQPNFTSPCTSGGYNANKTDLNSNGNFDVGDRVIETYSNCAFNLGNITVTGSISSTVTARGIRNISMDIRHANLNVTLDGKTYLFNGRFLTTADTDNILINMENQYKGYSLSYGGYSNIINAGNSVVTLHMSQDTYKINQSFVFKGNTFSGIFRSDTAGTIQGSTTTNNQNVYPFRGRLRIESTNNGNALEINSEDNDNNVATYSSKLRANSTTEETTGLLWSNLLN